MLEATVPSALAELGDREAARCWKVEYVARLPNYTCTKTNKKHRYMNFITKTTAVVGCA